MNLRRLSYFVLACQQQGFASAADEIGITQSTLSVSLKALSEEIGMPLFEHVHRRFHPTAAGLWLFRCGLPLLHAESFARTWVAQGGDTGPQPDYLIVEVRLSFALGRVTKAVSGAIEAMRQEFPSTFIELHFTGAGLNGNDTVPIGRDLIEGRHSRVIIDAVSPDEADADGDARVSVPLLEDEWVFVQNASGSDGPPDSGNLSPNYPVVVPALSEGLRVQLARFVAEHAMAGVESIDESPGALPRLIAERPHAVFLLPHSMVAERLSRANVVIRQVKPAFRNRVVARHDPGSHAAVRLVEQIRAHLGGPERNVVFNPALTFRQIRYHQVLYRWRNITAAARSLSVAQPSVTEQLRKMEQVLDCQLFERSRDGLRPTSAGPRMNSIGAIMEEGLRRMMVQRASINGMQGNQVRLGMLPTTDPGSMMLGCIADAVSRWQSSHAAYRLKVFEAPSSTLQEMVANGTISLAVVERDISELARLSLSEAEPLMLIADPRYGLVSGSEIDFAAAVRLPLMLPTPLAGIRQILDAAAALRGIKLNIVSEINSMALMMALLHRQAVCTVLPASAVRSQMDSGELVAVEIVQPTISRRFYAIYSAERKLTDPERDFVRELRGQFQSRALAEPALPSAGGCVPVNA